MDKHKKRKRGRPKGSFKSNKSFPNVNYLDLQGSDDNYVDNERQLQNTELENENSLQDIVHDQNLGYQHSTDDETYSSNKHIPASDKNTFDNTVDDSENRQKPSESFSQEHDIVDQENRTKADEQKITEDYDPLNVSKRGSQTKDYNVVTPNSVLSVVHLKKRYKSLTEYVFEDLNFELYEGDIVGILGQNGAGKSTLLKCLTGLTPIDEGEIFIRNSPMEENRQKIGVLWVEAGMLYQYTIRANLQIWCQIYNITYNEEKIVKLLNEFGVGHTLNKKFKLLSTGQRRKVCIARTFLNNVPLYLLDEATSGLDLASQLKVQSYIKDKANNEKKTFLFVTHLYTDLINLCTKVIMIDQGKIVDYCTIGELTLRYLTGYIFTLIMEAEPEVMQLIYLFLNEKNIKYIRGKRTERSNIFLLYLKFNEISEFNKYESVFNKYILSKKVERLSLETFLNLLLAGVIFKHDE